MATFDPINDKIAVTLSHFTMKKRSQGIFEGKFEEPYIVTLAADSHGSATPQIEFSTRPFPKVAVGETVTFQNHGHLIYGPKQPGEFAAYSILFMESDEDIRKIGERVSEIINSEETKAILKAVVTANPGAATVAGGLQQVLSLVARVMKQNRDDELFQTSGTLLRDVNGAPPYNILTSTTASNAFISCETTIVPLVAPVPGGLMAPGFVDESSLFSTLQTIPL
ncbi:MAG: hypothetical protein AAGJ79_00835 [Verrucomicrobiota bacterium]